MLQPIAPMLDYIINYEYISTVLCINRDKPELECKGQCHLAKELKKTIDSTQDDDVLQISMEKYPIGFVEVLKLKSIKNFIVLEKLQSYYEFNYQFALQKAIDHPPENLI